MPANECIPYKEPGGRITGTPTVAVVGKRAVAITGNRQADGTYSIGPCPAGVKPFGWAAWDAAIGTKVTILRQPGYILPATSGAAIAAGAEVEIDATARVVTKAAGVAVGRVLTAVGAADTDSVLAIY